MKKKMKKPKKKTKKPDFLKDSIGKKVKNSLIPTEENDYLPKALGFKSLSAIVIILVILKVFATLFLFTIYPKAVYLSSDIYCQIIELTNKTRIENGVSPLTTNPILDQAAQAKAQDMFLRQYFSHDTPEGKKPWHWINKKDYDYISAGENLAMNFTSAEVAHLALLQSPTHKRNIVNSKFKDIGIAVLTGEMNGKKTMLMVEMFGRQRGGEINKSINQEIKKSIDQKIDESIIQEENKTDKQAINESKNQVESSEIVATKDTTIKDTKEIPPTNTDGSQLVAQVKNLETTDVKGTTKEISTDTKDDGKPITQEKPIKEKEENPNLLTYNQIEIKEIKERQDDVSMISSVEPKVEEIFVKSSVLNFKSNLINKVLKYLDYVLFSGLIFIIVLLTLNILIKIKIQRPAVIFQSVVTIGIIIILIISKLHFFQNLATRVIIG